MKSKQKQLIQSISQEPSRYGAGIRRVQGFIQRGKGSRSIGVLFSAIPVILYEGLTAIFANQIERVIGMAIDLQDTKGFNWIEWRTLKVFYSPSSY